MAETHIGLFKNECIRPDGPWRDVNHVEKGTFEWVTWFNTVRTHEAIDALTPIEAGEFHCAHHTALAEAGRLTKPSLQTTRSASLDLVLERAGTPFVLAQLAGLGDRDAGDLAAVEPILFGEPRRHALVILRSHAVSTTAWPGHSCTLA